MYPRAATLFRIKLSTDTGFLLHPPTEHGRALLRHEESPLLLRVWNRNCDNILRHEGRIEIVIIFMWNRYEAIQQDRVCYLMRKGKQNTKITNHMCKRKLHRISWLLKQYIAPSPDLNHANN
jgi:hypothetical protein